jgi:hypothetical protein
LYGNYSGLASSDESGRTSPGVNRFFDLPHIGFTAAGNPDNGRLPTDRPHVFNAYGSYSFNWFNRFKGHETRFGAFTTIQSGTPLTSYYTFLAESILYGRGDLGRAPIFTQSDFDIRHIYRVKENKTLEFDFNVINLFNEANTLTVVRTPASINPDRATLNLPASVNSNGAALGYILTNGIVSNFNNFLNNPANPERKNTALGFANGFQGGRQIRMGVRFTF